MAKWNNLPYTGVIDRPDLQEILLNNMEEGRVMNSKPIIEYIENVDGTVDVAVSYTHLTLPTKA